MKTIVFAMCALCCATAHAATQPNEVREATIQATQECASMLHEMVDANTNDTANGALIFLRDGLDVCSAEVDRLTQAKSVSEVKEIRQATRHKLADLISAKVKDLSAKRRH